MVRVAILALAVGPAPVRALAPGLAGALAPAEALSGFGFGSGFGAHWGISQVPN